jgi:predicted Zn-ribbon and HTH transcriptional regulator
MQILEYAGQYRVQFDTHVNQPTKDLCTRIAVCPECGYKLRSKKARQCPNCLLDWHDPENPKNLANIRPA